MPRNPVLSLTVEESEIGARAVMALEAIGENNFVSVGFMKRANADGVREDRTIEGTYITLMGQAGMSNHSVMVTLSDGSSRTANTYNIHTINGEAI